MQKYIAEQKAKEQAIIKAEQEKQAAILNSEQEKEAILKAEQEKQAAILKADPEKQAEREMGIDLCANANTKQVIKQYLAEARVGNIQSLSFSHAWALLHRVLPKCHKGHTINH